jgi:hypothetical protein
MGSRSLPLPEDAAERRYVHTCFRGCGSPRWRSAWMPPVVLDPPPAGNPSSASPWWTHVTKAIKAALAKICEQHPALGQHLSATIRRGCAVLPEVFRIDRLAVRELDEITVRIFEHAEVADDRASVAGALHQHVFGLAACGDLVDRRTRR